MNVHDIEDIESKRVSKEKNNFMLQVFQTLMLGLITSVILGGGAWMFHKFDSNNDLLIQLKEHAVAVDNNAADASKQRQKIFELLGKQKESTDATLSIIDRRVTVIEGTVVGLSSRVDKIDVKNELVPPKFR